MNRRSATGLALSALVLCLAAAPPPEHDAAGLVATDHVLASRAGAVILAAGGNAVDAAVAAALACGVVQPSSSGLGGGGFAVVNGPEASLVLDFREVAPARATRDMFVNAPAADASRVGGLAVAVPGEAAGLARLHATYGVLPLKEVVRPAYELAHDGFRVGDHLAHALDAHGLLAVALFDAPLPSRGDLVRRARLAATLRVFAKSGGRALYEGPIADDLVQAVASQGGILSREDLALYAPVEREPVVGHYRGWTVLTMPPPSSGGLVLLQLLGVLEGYDLAAMGHNSAALLHTYAEAMKHSFADRARYMGDPDRVQIPAEALLAPARLEQIRGQIDPERTQAPGLYGTVLDLGSDSGTQHISVLDRQGMAVALTTTVNTSFGSTLVAPRSGIVLNNEMDDFVARPGVPNAFGLVGSEANAVAPGARPLSSMTPTILLSPDGARRIVVGASGGPYIISSTLQAIVNVIDFGFDPAEAVSRPRIHHQWAPDKLFVDEGMSPDTVAALEERGHDVEVFPFFSAVQLVAGGAEGVSGASDPRKGGWPAGPGGL